MPLASTCCRTAFLILFFTAAAAAAEPPIFEAATRLLERKSDENWREVLGLALALRDETLRRAERSPLEKPGSLANLDKLIKLPKAAPGLHSLVHTVRYASTVPPVPTSSYLHTAAVVLHGDLAATTPQLLKTNRRPRGPAWDGYLHGCVLVVDGEIDMSGYIFDSIVIAKGPVRVGGYIYNSLVFSLGTEGESLIDVGGYLHSALVAAENVKVPGYVFQSIVYGTLESSDLRGADLRKPKAMLRLPWEVEHPLSLE
jgi:hypothetical protein